MKKIHLFYCFFTNYHYICEQIQNIYLFILNNKTL